jgi:hypothetical protein
LQINYKDSDCNGVDQGGPVYPVSNLDKPLIMMFNVQKGWCIMVGYKTDEEWQEFLDSWEDE